jgi:hypothetical protein
MAAHVGEIIASSTTRFTAQCPSEEDAPDFGGFVVVEAAPGRALAVVCEVRSGSFDAHRRPVAFGLSEEDLYQQQPQLRELLTTEFDALLVGYAADGEPWRQLLPPRPPRLHRFVHDAEPEAVRAVTAGGDYLRTLVAGEASDDLLAAAVRASLDASDDHSAAVVQAGQALARLLGDDYDRLRVLLRRVRP